MKKTFLTLAAALAVMLAAIGFADDKQNPTKKDGTGHSVLMKKKLEYTQNILAGLANEDFDQIHKNAKILNTFGALERWFRADSDAYRAQLKIFRFANDELIRLSEEKNLEGASLAYMQLTLSCVNCHSHVRKHAQ
jgi:hypothetical protein